MEKWLLDFFDDQLKRWSFAAKNAKALENVQKKEFRLGDLNGYVQFNPSRAVSTLAKLDKNTLSSRPCFLCTGNRPKEQKAFEILPGWDLLVNPFPILPYHFTIVNKNHIPQDINNETGLRLASKLSGMVVFYNDVGAGASAPDHMHFQAVPLEELPLIRLLEKEWDNFEELKLPFKIMTDPSKILENKRPLNCFYWQSGGSLRFVAIWRKAHRPKAYFLEPPLRRAFSPGAIDMTGVLVTPLKEDFEAINFEDIEKIYREVAFTNEEG